ncbi:hypothetical protein ACWEIJ_32425 [Lentzea sp. NPDC004789]
MSRRLCSALSTALLATAVVTAPAQAETLITDLGHLPGARSSRPVSINYGNQIVGTSINAAGVESAVQFDGFGTAREIVGPAGASTNVRAVNSYSAMAGTTYISRVGNRAIRFNLDETYTVLALPSGYSSAQGLAIDDAGTVYGVAVTRANKSIPMRWSQDGVPSPMTMPEGATSATITGASSNGYVSGHVLGIGASYLAVRWNPDGTVTMLAKLADASSAASSTAYAVNRFGEVVGNADTDQAKPTYGVRWNADGSVTTLGTKVYPKGVNDDGVAVGFTEVQFFNRPTRWTRNGDALDLGLPDGVGSGVALAINNRGLIVGTAGSAAVMWKMWDPR